MNTPESIDFHWYFPVCRNAFPFPAIRRCETVQGFSAIPVDGAMRRKLNKINAKSDINTVNNQLITDNNL
jgi:hypothetical protein